MATLYASAPGTSSGGSGTSGNPYTHIHEALAACSAGDTLIMKAGTYTQSMSWNSMITWGGWPSGSSGSPITVRPETFTADTTKGVPGGTSSVIWQTGGGSCLNWTTPSAIKYWDLQGIVFDATNFNVQDSGYIIHNNDAQNIGFRNCHFKNHGLTSEKRVVLIEYSVSSGTNATRNNLIEYCKFSADSPLNNPTDDGDANSPSHWVYCRMSGNTFQFNEWDLTNGGKCAIQFFTTSASERAINDNVVRYNIFRDGATTNTIGNILFSLNCNRNKIYRNLFYGSSTRQAIDLRGGSGVTGAADANEIHSNTIVGCGQGIRINVSGFTNTSVINNIAYDNGSTAADNFVDSGTSTSTATNSFDGTDPVFDDPGNDDYHISSSSPTAIKTGGTQLGSPEDDQDFEGNAVGATTSIGAYELTAVTPPEAPINVYSSVGYVTEKNVAIVIDDLAVTDNNDPDLLQEVWLFCDTGGTWTNVDTTGGATSVDNP